MTFPFKAWFSESSPTFPTQPHPIPTQASLRLPSAPRESPNSLAWHSRCFKRGSCVDSLALFGAPPPPHACSPFPGRPGPFHSPGVGGGGLQVLLSLLPGHLPGRGRIGPSLCCTLSSLEQRPAAPTTTATVLGASVPGLTSPLCGQLSVPLGSVIVVFTLRTHFPFSFPVDGIISPPCFLPSRALASPPGTWMHKPALPTHPHLLGSVNLPNRAFNHLTITEPCRWAGAGD